MPTELYGAEILDAIAIHARANVSAIHKAYAAKAGTQSDEGTLIAIPEGMDDSPCLLTTMGPMEVEPGGPGPEITRYWINGDIWVKASNAGTALQLVTPIPDLLKIAFRSLVDVNGTATMGYFTGADEPVPEDLNNTPWLRTRCRWRVTTKITAPYSQGRS